MIFPYWGEDKSCKDTLGLTFPKKLVVMEFDVGGFKRACRNLPHAPIKDWYEAGLIAVEPFVLPFQVGKFDPIENIVRPVKIVQGMKELYYDFVAKFFKYMQDPEYNTIMIDTGTILYDVVCQAYLQELQETQLPMRPDGKGRDGKPFRKQLQQIEYKEPNARIGPFAYHAKAHNKNLVITHHATDEYGLVRNSDGSVGQGPTGKRVLQGWKKWGHAADILGHTFWDSRSRTAKFEIELAEIKELEGVILENPTYEQLDRLISIYRG